MVSQALQLLPQTRVGLPGEVGVRARDGDRQASVSERDGIHQSLVLIPSVGGPLEGHWRKVPAETSVQQLQQFQKHRIAGETVDVAVERYVGLDENSFVLRLDSAPGRLDLASELIDVLGADETRRQGRCLAFQQRAYLEELVDLFARGLVDERTLARVKIYPALGLQQVKSLPNRATADPEALGQIGLDQMLTRLVRAVNDQPLKTFTHPLPQGPMVQHFVTVGIRREVPRLLLVGSYGSAPIVLLCTVAGQQPSVGANRPTQSHVLEFYCQQTTESKRKG